MEKLTENAVHNRKDTRVASRLGVTAESQPSRSFAPVQAKLETTTPGDSLEMEADRMADYVTGKTMTPASGRGKPAGAPSISAYGGTSVSIPPKMESQLSVAQGSGQPMPFGLMAQMESSFGHDFSNVRIHTDDAAAQMSDSINAKAFTSGNDIYFNQGQFRPETTAGQHLIAHELTHTIQQSGRIARSGGDEQNVSKENSDDHSIVDNRGPLDIIADILGLSQILIDILADESLIVTGFRERKFLLEIMQTTKESLLHYAANKYSFRNATRNFDEFAELEKLVKFEKTSGALAKVKKYGKGTFDIVSWGLQVIDWLLKSISTWRIAVRSDEASATVNAVYTTVRLLTTCADAPFIKYPPHVAAILKSWNTGCAVGDIVNDLFDIKFMDDGKTSISDLRVREMEYMAETWGGSDSVSGTVAAAVTSIPVVGEIATGLTYGVETASEYASEVMNSWLNHMMYPW